VQDKSRISVEMVFVMTMANYTWQDYETNKNVLSKLNLLAPELGI
jgi:hypothetical protein